jgi:hypothetical protein
VGVEQEKGKIGSLVYDILMRFLVVLWLAFFCGEVEENRSF